MMTTASLGSRDGPEDIDTESITIIKYWDIYAPPPKDSTKGKFGNVFTFLNDNISRQRRLSIEKHVLKKYKYDNSIDTKSKNSPKNNNIKHYIRISKDSEQDGNFKTKYLIEVSNFEVLTIHKESKKVHYKTYENGDEHEGSFVFVNHQIEDVHEFQSLLMRTALEDPMIKNETERKLPSPSINSAHFTAPSQPPRSTIASLLVERRSSGDVYMSDTPDSQLPTSGNTRSSPRRRMSYFKKKREKKYKMTEDLKNPPTEFVHTGPLLVSDDFMVSSLTLEPSLRTPVGTRKSIETVTAESTPVSIAERTKVTDGAPSDIETGHQNHTANETSPSNTSTRKKCKCCTNLLNLLHIGGILVASVILAYSIAILRKQPDPLIIVGVALSCWSVFILISYMTGLLRSHGLCTCCTSCINSSLCLAICSILVNVALIIVLHGIEPAVLDYLRQNHEKLYLTEHDIDVITSNIIYVYVLIVVGTFFEVFR